MGVTWAIEICMPTVGFGRIEIGEEGVGEDLEAEFGGETEERGRALGLDVRASGDFGDSSRFRRLLYGGAAAKVANGCYEGHGMD